MRSIIHYYGGKHYMVKYLLELIPEHSLYVEPFFGGGNFFFSKEPSKMEIINDLAENIYALYSVIADSAGYKRLQERLELTPYSAQFRDEFKQRLNQADLPTEDRAFYYLYVNRTSFNGVGGFSCTTLIRNSMIRSVSDYLSLIPHLEKVHNRLRRAVVEKKHAFDLLTKYNRKDTFFYLDPPYIQSTRSSGQKYMIEMSDDEHRRLVEMLLTTEAKVMLSGYDHPIYSKLTDKGWKKLEFKLPNVNSDRIECVWLNYTISCSPQQGQNRQLKQTIRQICRKERT